jgi:hypothetical protein
VTRLTHSLARFAESLTEARQLEQVLQMAKTIKVGSMEQQSMLSRIAISFAIVGQPEQALQLASTIKRDDEKALYCIASSGAWRKLGNMNKL